MFNIDKFCRLCLTGEGVTVRLFDDSHENNMIPLYAKVMSCISVKIQWDDGLPTLLCQTCSDRVNTLWCFKEFAEHVECALRKLLKNHELNADYDWEEKMKQIALDAQSTSSSKRKRRRAPLSPSKAASASPEKINKDVSRSHVSLEEELSAPIEDEADRLLSSTPPPLSQRPLSPKASNPNDADIDQAGCQKKKRKTGRKTEYICEFCGRKFLRSNHLVRHELTHIAEKPFQCSDCDKTFWYKASLIGHIKQTHTGDVNYTCDICGKGFFKKTELSRHKPTHSSETPHKCEQCGLGFKITKTLKRHIRNVHTAQRSHTCHTCGKSFVQFQTLKVHMLLHTGEKPYVCSYCGKGFAQSAPLKTHIRIHTGERPYSCHTCGDSFTNRTALTVHAFKHSDTLPYPCSRCSSGFRLKKELVQHEQGHDDLESRLERFPKIKAEAEESPDESQCEEVLTDSVSTEPQQQGMKA